MVVLLLLRLVMVVLHTVCSSIYVIQAPPQHHT
jgi:hypothetical protein